MHLIPPWPEDTLKRELQRRVQVAFVGVQPLGCRLVAKGIKCMAPNFISAPVQAGPDFGGEGDEGEGVLELEGPFGGLVAEEAHAEQTAGPAAHGTEQAEKRFRYARAGAGGAPFVVAEG